MAMQLAPPPAGYHGSARLTSNRRGERGGRGGGQVEGVREALMSVFQV